MLRALAILALLLALLGPALPGGAPHGARQPEVADAPPACCAAHHAAHHAGHHGPCALCTVLASAPAAATEPVQAGRVLPARATLPSGRLHAPPTGPPRLG
ncbi:hypothetical protein BCF33_1277 [Hasllibacter halocynthiae]|uniref:DUF2946 family protein n=1 Tax=Hasllibacter halocynthiae TaxID=595589 RepID=A0A2T0X9Q5_9RHOB|nr:hypothetical protein [Hasllibacter halocynthiae]PRY95655.1 hypothetical protein BCF33_1277 [Hasllibacter halocynthiae]